MQGSKEGPIRDSSRQERIRLIAMVGLSVALIAVSAWITIPLGAIPFTLQMLSITLIMGIVPARGAIGAIYAYVLLGCLGLPLFSGFRGGFGVLMGPTGGFLVGYLVGVPAGAIAIRAIRSKAKPGFARYALSTMVGGLLFTAIADMVGCIQYSLVASIPIEAAFFLGVAPFLLPDLAKIAVGALCAGAVKLSLRF